VQIGAISATPFPIPLKEPFAISRASVDSTRAVLVRAEVSRRGKRAVGFGEAALPLGAELEPRTLEEQITLAAGLLQERRLPSVAAATSLLDECFRGSPVARSGLHCALVDAAARLEGKPLFEVLGGKSSGPLVTDITLPIADPKHLAGLARRYFERGFRCFKIKVGADLSADLRTVRLVAEATPGASVLFDANMGFDAREALALLDGAREVGLQVSCFEQPCAREDFDGLRRVRASGVPVIADESVRDLADLERLHREDAVDGVNLKLVKMGGIDRCLALGKRAQELGLRLMVGAMIESRLGLTAMAHVASALGGAEWVDLDTAFLLARDPWRGGMEDDGPRLTLPMTAGLGMELSAQ